MTTASGPTGAPVADQKTLTLVNTFVAQTVDMLNRLNAACERKLADAQRRIQSVDITLKILEAKINSVEGLDAAPSTSETETRAPPPTDAREAPPPPPPPTTTTNLDDQRADASDVDRTASAPSSAPLSAPLSAPPDDGGPKIRDDPRYSLYFKMVRMGVPAQAVKNKMALEGFSPAEADLLDDPDAPAPG